MGIYQGVKEKSFQVLLKKAAYIQ